MRAPNLTKCLKGIAKAVSCVLMCPLAALSGFGRIPAMYTFFAHTVALVPGIPGDYLRVAYYSFTLRECPLACCISFGTFFAHPDAAVGRNVYIGAYCVVGNCRIGDRTHISSLVQILSGRQQHGRDSSGRLGGADHERFTTLEIGADCWIGASSIVMADVGAASTIGAGAVVVKPIPDHVVAVGNPAVVLRHCAES